MAENRQARIATLRGQQAWRRALQEIAALFSSLNEVEFTIPRDDPESFASSWDLYQLINTWEAEPFSQVPVEAEEAEWVEWLSSCLARLGREDEYLVALAGYWGLPWVKVRVCEPSDWLYSLWRQLEPRELILMSGDHEYFLGFKELEHHYTAHLRETSEAERHGLAEQE